MTKDGLQKNFSCVWLPHVHTLKMPQFCRGAIDICVKLYSRHRGFHKLPAPQCALFIFVVF